MSYQQLLNNDESSDEYYPTTSQVRKVNARALGGSTQVSIPWGPGEADSSESSGETPRKEPNTAQIKWYKHVLIGLQFIFLGLASFTSTFCIVFFVTGYPSLDISSQSTIAACNLVGFVTGTISTGTSFWGAINTLVLHQLNSNSRRSIVRFTQFIGSASLVTSLGTLAAQLTLYSIVKSGQDVSNFCQLRNGKNSERCEEDLESTWIIFVSLVLVLVAHLIIVLFKVFTCQWAKTLLNTHIGQGYTNPLSHMEEGINLFESSTFMAAITSSSIPCYWSCTMPARKRRDQASLRKDHRPRSKTIPFKKSHKRAESSKSGKWNRSDRYLALPPSRDQWEWSN